MSTMNTDENEIRAIFQSITDAIKVCDAKGAMARYIEDVLVFDIAPPLAAIGRAGNEKGYRDFFNGTDGPWSLEYSDIKVKVYPGGQDAIATSFAVLRAKLKTGEDLSVSSRITSVYEKINGVWMIVHEHASVPVDVATGMAVFNAEKTGLAAHYFQG